MTVCVSAKMPNKIVSICALLLFCTLSQVDCSATKYYLTRNELKKRYDDQKKPTKDPIHTSNSNAYFVEDGLGYGNGYDSQELVDYEQQDGYGYSGHRYMPMEKKHSKFFGDELSFVIIVVTLTVFFGILS